MGAICKVWNVGLQAESEAPSSLQVNEDEDEKKEIVVLRRRLKVLSVW